MNRLGLLFVLVTSAEVLLLVLLGNGLGPLPTFGLIVATGLVGGWVARAQGLAVLQRIAGDLQRGQPPAAGLVEGGLVVAGGLLLLTPGVLTDVLGFAFVLPPTRSRLAPLVIRWVSENFTVQGLHVDLGPAGPRPPGAPPRAPRRPADGRPPSADASPFDHPVA